MGSLAACSTTSNIRACENHDQCPTGQSCIENACIVNVSESCGPAGVTCQSFEVCSQSGTCECSTDLANTPEACGCAPLVNCADVAASPIMQMACILNESKELECVCDETYHAFDDGACGCELENCEKDGNVCENGACSCVVANHMYDSHSCACGAACAGGEICSAGECICAEGTTRCGDDCIPYGYTCCNADADDEVKFCQAGTTCRSKPDGNMACQPQGTTPCFNGEKYIGNCAPEETCIVDEDDQLHCLAPGVPACLKDGNYFGHCAPGETCIVDDAEMPHCLPPGASACFKGDKFFGQCDPKETCIVDDAKVPTKHCVPPGAAPCYAGLDFKDICGAGTKCANGKCIAPEESLCGDLDEVCLQGQTCVEWAMGQYKCHPAGATACYASDNYYGWACNPGWNCGQKADTCSPPGWKECPDLSLCSPSEKCIKVNKEGGYKCAPNEAVVCYELEGDVNVAKKWCPAYQQCSFDGTFCLPPGWTECGAGVMCPQGETCVPKSKDTWTCFYPGSVACYEDGWFHHACPINQKCTGDGCAA